MKEGRSLGRSMLVNISGLEHLVDLYLDVEVLWMPRTLRPCCLFPPELRPLPKCTQQS